MRSIIRWYSAKYGVREEYIIPGGGFRNLNDFFTRKLKPGIHVIDTSGVIVSPVDATIEEHGEISGGTIIQAKGINYSLRDLVPSDTAEKFAGGSFITLYLSPGDYHRIHSPVTGKILGYFAIPGKLFPVQEFMVNGIPGLFAINERLITYIGTEKGLVAVCKIGAMNVGRITVFYDHMEMNKTFSRKKEHFYPEDLQKDIAAGGELGTFNLGSTIILLFGKNMAHFGNGERAGKVRVGEKIGRFV